ncbi:DUF2829 domain-containing protein [Parabacteroides merdae]|uniref:DUF2829 domain-containing protein n=1 Tax=Parabacteroides merdae TaxID=46503 RepID=UPI001C2366BB|nr:DUF2829 domain-containing protein [Parabacteroides merdae]MBU9060696.1 DUF2829 domain-containing protein [Parabacteroides merdae]MCG4836446.1 DUF2829 domain-containing protein [Parabacteroides merdae]MCQ5194710.1 DUF2829 domain-containing protein [Parabacteroides merdae]
MKKYIGTKQIEAEPMTRGDAWGKHLLREKPSTENFDDEGYHVRYEDGYESWSPKDVFEKAYMVADTPSDRILIEGRELTDRLTKLKNFILSDKFDELDSDSQAMLYAQVGIMQGYQHILNLRYPKIEGNNVRCESLYFGSAISLLCAGFAIRRKGWNGKGLFVIKQVPAHIDSDIIPKMQSLPQSAKDLILKGKGFIDYTSQCLIYNENTGRADSWVPSISDVFAEDWEIVK